ncbi:outer envelope pore protein 16, chloroplastic-like [Corylus avellana]|uniref:outer envelope pore protein 16, chloroplastic-like n=1 Tax=Corylus avellana TaxID=13451 RepID=UPI00286B6D5F|nr:outer envelope pore protein 16, chloroplastic-like [Corylus avellana]
MPHSSFSGSLTTPTVDVAIDTGNAFFNHTIDGFLKIGAVAATRAAAEDAYDAAKRGSISRHNLEHSLKKMCKEGAYWGTVAAVYVGMEYAVEGARGTRDWKNATIGGALTGAITGALISAAGHNNKDKVVVDAITGAAIATAAEFLNYLT